MNRRQKIAVVVLDVLLIVELCLSMYWAGRDPLRFTPTFLKTFFLMVVPTLILARVSVRKLRSRTAEAGA
jgi:hypothetical protein